MSFWLLNLFRQSSIALYNAKPICQNPRVCPNLWASQYLSEPQSYTGLCETVNPQRSHDVQVIETIKPLLALQHHQARFAYLMSVLRRSYFPTLFLCSSRSGPGSLHIRSRRPASPRPIKRCNLSTPSGSVHRNLTHVIIDFTMYKKHACSSPHVIWGNKA